MIRIRNYALILAMAINLLTVSPAESCSTFMLSRDDCLIVGHNLDQEFYTPGVIHVNRRGETKRSINGFDLGLTDVQTPTLMWSAKYGSVTFSLLGRNLPDGGMNEAGLTVSEMGLGESVFPFYDSLPTMLSHLWIQYQLDNYATVGEVLSHLREINIEASSTFTPPASANYHFFVSDSTGRVAIIEFLESGAEVYVDESVPIPLLCNRTYRQELKLMDKYEGLIGWVRRQFDSSKDLRFVKGAAALKSFNAKEDGPPVEYGFDILSQMQFARTKQWSVIYDIRERSVYFRTNQNSSIKHFAFDRLDFSPEAPSKIIEDIDGQLKGDISGSFVDFNRDADKAVIDKFLRSLVRFVAKSEDADTMDSHMIENYNLDVRRYVERALETTERIRQ